MSIIQLKDKVLIEFVNEINEIYALLDNYDRTI